MKIKSNKSKYKKKSKILSYIIILTMLINIKLTPSFKKEEADLELGKEEITEDYLRVLKKHKTSEKKYNSRIYKRKINP